MKLNKTLLLAAGAVAVSVTGAFALRSDSSAGPPALPAQPASAQVRVIEWQPFELGESLTHHYRAEQPSYSRGWLVVLEAPRELLASRQVAEPVLYVGDETAARVNIGADSGRLIAIVPDFGDLDIETAPVFFGAAQLPEQVTREMARAELTKAQGLGVQAAVERAERGLAPIELPDAYELYYYASTLVARHSPQEIDLIQGLQVPRLK